MTRAALQALAALLCYPGEDLVLALPELQSVLGADAQLGRPTRRRLDEWFASLPPSPDTIAAGADDDLLAWQERYVGLFDRSPRRSLHLFEHVYGDSRVCGQAMVALLTRYRRAGLEPTANKLPDYLPMVLEFAAQAADGETETLLREIAPLVAQLRERLVEDGDTYAALAEAVLDLAGERYPRRKGRRPAPVVEEDLAAIDKAWEDAPVDFGPAADPCPPVGPSVPGRQGGTP